MLKAIVLLKRRSDMSREDFIDYYENKHVPLVRQLLPTIGHYSRNYLDLDISPKQHESVSEVTAPPPYFDVITEIWFEGQSAYDQFVADLLDPEVSRRLQQDEANFLDRRVIQTFMADERISPEMKA